MLIEVLQLRVPAKPCSLSLLYADASCGGCPFDLDGRPRWV